MAEYTYEDIIIDPNDTRLNGIIGNEVYFSDAPLKCLKYANGNYKGDILKEIYKDNAYPFRIKTSDGSMPGFVCIIIKKEEPKPNYVPFRTKEEFLDAYFLAEHYYTDNNLSNLSGHGIWLQRVIDEGIVLVTEIWDDGVVVGDNKLVIIGNSSLMNETTRWKELLEKFKFLDGSPCGKEVEE